MTEYDLQHLTLGNDCHHPAIQDDEALLLYALIRCMRLQTVLEVGALQGYSARNFLAAVGFAGCVISVDIVPLQPLAPNHRTIQCSIQDVDFVSLPALDLVFFDAHAYDEQLLFFERGTAHSVITPRTIIALHDTGLFYEQTVSHAHRISTGWVHQCVERRMVNHFVSLGYSALCAHADNQLPPRKGLTIMQRFTALES